MASLLNSVRNGKSEFIGYWEEIDEYNSVTLTMQSPFDGSCCFEWANNTGRKRPTNSDVIASETVAYTRGEPITHQLDHRGRWFRFTYKDIADTAFGLPNYEDMCLNIETMYKRDATELKIANDSQTITSVQHGDLDSAYQIVLSDTSGVKLRTTNDAVQSKHEALYVTPRDAENSKLAFTVSGDQGAKSLFVGLRDNCNHNLSSTSDPNVDVSTLYIHPSNLHGYSQAGTAKVQMGAGENGTDGVALYLSAAGEKRGIASTFELKTDRNGHPAGNSLSVHLVHNQGQAVNKDSPLPVTKAGTIGQAKPFDIDHGIQEIFTSLPDTTNAKVDLTNLFTYNDGPVPTWTKVYDICSGMISSTNIRFSLNKVLNSNGDPVESDQEDLINELGVYFRVGEEQHVNSTDIITNEYNHLSIIKNNPKSEGLQDLLNLPTNTELVISEASRRIASVGSGWPLSNSEFNITPDWVGTSRTEYYVEVGGIVGLGQVPVLYSQRITDAASHTYSLDFAIGARNTILVVTVKQDSADHMKFYYHVDRGYFYQQSNQICYRINVPTSLDDDGRIYNGLEFKPYESKVKLNFATPPGQCRDLKFPQGLRFENGLYFRCTVQSEYDSTISPGEDVVFINGGYYRTEAEAVSEAKVNQEFEFGQVGSTSRDINFEDSSTLLERELDFRSGENENTITGIISLLYNKETEGLKIGILVSQSNLILNDITLSYDFLGNQLNYDIDTTNYQLNQQIQTEDINLNPDQVLDSTLTLGFENRPIQISLGSAFIGSL